MVLAAWLLTAPAVAAPEFPLYFEGNECGNGRCRNFELFFYADGSLLEVKSGFTGTYTWDPETRQFYAVIDDLVRTVMIGTKRRGERCIEGDWITNDPEVYGWYWFCEAVPE